MLPRSLRDDEHVLPSKGWVAALEHRYLANRLEAYQTPHAWYVLPSVRYATTTSLDLGRSIDGNQDQECFYSNSGNWTSDTAFV